MYSQPGGRPGPGRGGKGRYIKGRLPQGVDFAAYPGRSSTPLPTAESKSAERINQLKIWNEAATNDDKRRLHTAQSKQALTTAGSANRRTDSFKDARERHSASFQSDATKDPAAPAQERDIFADRSDSDSDDAPDADPAPPPPAPAPAPVPTSRVSEATSADDDVVEAAAAAAAAAAPPPPTPPIAAPPPPPPRPADPLAQPARPHAPAPPPPAPAQPAYAAPTPVPMPAPARDPAADAPRQSPKASKGCCTIQ